MEGARTTMYKHRQRMAHKRQARGKKDVDAAQALMPILEQEDEDFEQAEWDGEAEMTTSTRPANSPPPHQHPRKTWP